MTFFNSLPKWIKIPLIIFLSLCCVMDIWYILLKKYSPERETDYRFVLNELEGVDDDNKEIMQLRYFSNENNNGQEMLEVRINSLIDESTNQTYSVGIQILGTKENPISFNNERKTVHVDLVNTNFRYYVTTKNERYAYNASNGTTFNASTEMKEANSFLVTMGKDSDNNPVYYKLTFKNKDFYSKSDQSEKFVTDKTFLWMKSNYSQEYNLAYLVKGLFDRVQGAMKVGTDQKVLFKFSEDLFQYSIKIKDNTYEDIIAGTEEASHVRASVENYFYVKLNKYADGVRTASDSLFGVVANNYTYGEGNKLDYYNAQQILELHETDFDFIKDTLTNYKLKLTTSALKKIEAYNSENFAIKILLNKEKLKELNVTPIGFADGTEIENYNIFKVCLVSNGVEEVLSW